MKASKLLLIALLLAAASCSSERDGHRVVGELTSDRIELTAETAEPIIEIAVAEGSAVAAGDVLVRQNAERANARLAEALAQLAQAGARLDELIRGPRGEKISAARASVDGAVRDLEFREAEFARAREVHARNLASPESLDRARAAYDAAQANLRLRRAQLEELLAGTTIEELAQAEQALKQAEARRDSARIDVDRHTLRAPVDGIVDSRLFEPGERPVPGHPVMIVLGGDQAYARVYVPEYLRVSVAAGTPARIHIDGVSEALDGRVRWIASEAAFTPYFALTERDRSRLSYVAKIDIVEDRPRLPDGIPVEVEFLTGADE